MPHQLTDDDIFGACGRLRRELADWLETLSPEQLSTPSLCDEWTVRDVSAHLTRVLTLSNAKLLLAALRRGGNLHRANSELARAEGALPLPVQLRHLRDHADTRMRPPAVGALGPLTDLLVHDGDMRIPLGLPMRTDPGLAVAALDFLTTRAPGFVPRNRLRGLQLVVTDADRSWGAGAVIEATMANLMMAVCGRRVVLDRLSGPGVAVLSGRI